MRVGEPIGPLIDLTLKTPSGTEGDARLRTISDELSNLDVASETPGSGVELPLFQQELPPPSRPRPAIPRAPSRPPLAVRRPTPEVTRLKTRPGRRHEPGPVLDLELPAVPDSPVLAVLPVPGAAPDEPRTRTDVSGQLNLDSLASPGQRVTAGLIDAVLLAGIDATVLYFTLRLCNLTFAEAGTLPFVPLLGFFAILNGGYLTLFTLASGQTIGKMARGIKVVHATGPLGAKHAVLRTIGYLASALPAGLGFVSGVLRADRLTFHDRLAGTQVVRA
jgi:uncharacterized RDD family membrane protein YckC